MDIFEKETEELKNALAKSEHERRKSWFEYQPGNEKATFSKDSYEKYWPEEMQTPFSKLSLGLQYWDLEEVRKTSNRDFTTGFYFENNSKENLNTSKQSETHKYIAVVLEFLDNGHVLVEHRNKFLLGDELEILSNGENFNKKFIVEDIIDCENNHLKEVKKIKQHVYVKCPYKLNKYDILRKKEI